MTTVEASNADIDENRLSNKELNLRELVQQHSLMGELVNHLRDDLINEDNFPLIPPEQLVMARTAARARKIRGLNDIRHELVSHDVGVSVAIRMTGLARMVEADLASHFPNQDDITLKIDERLISPFISYSDRGEQMGLINMALGLGLTEWLDPQINPLLRSLDDDGLAIIRNKAKSNRGQQLDMLKSHTPGFANGKGKPSDTIRG